MTVSASVLDTPAAPRGAFATLAVTVGDEKKVSLLVMLRSMGWFPFS